MASLNVGFLVFPRLTQLDLTGPYEVLSRIPGARLHLLSRDPGPVVAEGGLTLLPTGTLSDAPSLEVICVPGGNGVNVLLEDDAVLDWLAAQGARARFVTSVCTGALVLGAAGLLRGYLATTHWLFIDLLPIFGATPLAERVVLDRNRVTGGGVTAGIDFGLTLAAQLFGEEAARRIALGLEYAPAPPYPGSPRSAAPALVTGMAEAARPQREERRKLCQLAAARRKLG
ncbi:MAG TPA: DJ-1/PfpI family protein [Anaeromyxobacter sp.]|nr:DJ-1/PfpI family protein [Anaeromyxobacter sp.]